MRKRALLAVLIAFLMAVGLCRSSAAAKGFTTHSLPHFSRVAETADRHLLTSLGVEVDRLEEELVSRGDFVRLAVQLKGKESTAQALSAVPLAADDADEVAQKHRGYLAAAVAFDLMHGGEGVRLRAEDPVNLAEALVVVLRMLGQKLPEDSPYPASALIAAEDEGLLDAVCEDLRCNDYLAPKQVVELLAAACRRRPPYGSVSGILAAVEGDVLHVFGEGGRKQHPVAAELYLSGAERLGAAVRQMMRGYLNDEGKVTYLETHREIITSEGALEDFSPTRGRILVGQQWFEVDPECELVVWSVNGWDRDRLTGAQLCDMLQDWVQSAAELTLHRTADGIYRVEVLHWDVPQAVVTAVNDDAEVTELTFLYENMEIPGHPVQTVLQFDSDCAVQVGGDVGCVHRLQVGDVLRVATPDASGMLWDSEYIYRIEVVRSRISGTLDPGQYGVRRSAKEGVRYILTLDDDRRVEVDPEFYLGDLDSLLDDTAAVELSLDWEGRPVYAAESLTLQKSMSPVQLVQYWETAEGCFLQARYGTLEVVHQTRLCLDELPELNQPEGWPTMVSIGFDSDYVVNSVELAVEVVYPRATVVAVNCTEDFAVLRVDDQFAEPHYLLAVSPLVFDGESSPAKINRLIIGDEVCVLSDGETLVLIEGAGD